MTLRKNIKRQARQALQGSWGQARLILIILLGLGFCINALDASAMSLLGYRFEYQSLGSFAYSANFFYEPMSALVSAAIWLVRLIIVAPLGVGMLGWYLDLTDRRRQGVSNIFSPYESRTWLRAVWLQICVAVRVALFSIPVLAVPLLLIGLLDHFYYPGTGPLYLGLTLLGLLLLLPAVAVVVIFSKRYALASMLLTQRYSMTTREAIRHSVRCTRGRCTELFLLDLSFLPWVLPSFAIGGMMFYAMGDPFSLMPTLLLGVLCIIVAITVFKVQPYYTMTELMYTRYLYEYAAWKQQTPAPEPEVQPQAPAYGSQSRPSVQWESVDPSPATFDPTPEQTPDSGVLWHDIPD